jgi:hypothetical protein
MRDPWTNRIAARGLGVELADFDHFRQGHIAR